MCLLFFRFFEKLPLRYICRRRFGEYLRAPLGWGADARGGAAGDVLQVKMVLHELAIIFYVVEIYEVLPD